MRAWMVAITCLLPVPLLAGNFSRVLDLHTALLSSARAQHSLCALLVSGKTPFSTEALVLAYRALIHVPETSTRVLEALRASESPFLLSLVRSSEERVLADTLLAVHDALGSRAHDPELVARLRRLLDDWIAQRSDITRKTRRAKEQVRRMLVPLHHFQSTGFLSQLGFERDGDRALFLSTLNQVSLYQWDGRSAPKGVVLSQAGGGKFCRMAPLPHGRIAVTGLDNQVSYFSSELVFEFAQPIGSTCAIFSVDGELMAEVSSATDTFQIWRRGRAANDPAPPRVALNVEPERFTPQGDALVLRLAQRKQLWFFPVDGDRFDPEHVVEYQGALSPSVPDPPPFQLEYDLDPIDSRVVLSNAYSNEIEIRDWKSRALLLHLATEELGALGFEPVVFSGDGGYVLAVPNGGPYSGRIAVWNSLDGTLLDIVTPPEGEKVIELHFGPDNRLLTGSLRGSLGLHTARLWQFLPPEAR